MAQIEIIPTQVKLSLTISGEERDVLLAALDFARAYLAPRIAVPPPYPKPASWYQEQIDPIEQLLAGTL